MAQLAGGGGGGSTCDRSHLIDTADDTESGRSRCAVRVEPTEGTAAKQPTESSGCGLCIDPKECPAAAQRPAESSSCCAVCMDDPMEWVAIGACGHREVCGECAVRYRFFRYDHRCIICRTPCPTVVVTKAGSGMRAFSRPPAWEGRVGVLWYHSGAAVYFEDKQQYEATKTACSQPKPPPPCPPRPRSQRRDANANGVHGSCSCCSGEGFFWFFVALTFLLGLIALNPWEN